MIRSVSYSRLLDFESCAYRAKLKYVDKVPEEKSEAADRGTMIHQLAEDFVKGKIKELPPELRKFEDDFYALRARYKAKQVSLEGEWGFSKDWEVVDWRHAYLRMKLDACMIEGPRAVVIDHKTGSDYGKEIQHGEQCQLYAIATFIRNPQLKSITTELWYLDKDNLRSMTYSRETAMRYLKPYEKRFARVTSAKSFEPNPNVFSCKWCPFGPNKGKQCPHGVTENHDHVKAYRARFG